MVTSMAWSLRRSLNPRRKGRRSAQRRALASLRMGNVPPLLTAAESMAAGPRIALYNCAMAELTAEMMATLRCRYGLDVRAATGLEGGYDIWADSWRLDTDRGPLVVRVDGSLSAQTASWLGDVVARAASAGVPCAAPVSALDGSAAVAVEGAQVTVRPFVDGSTWIVTTPYRSWRQAPPSQGCTWHCEWNPVTDLRRARGPLVSGP